MYSVAVFFISLTLNWIFISNNLLSEKLQLKVKIKKGKFAKKRLHLKGRILSNLSWPWNLCGGYLCGKFQKALRSVQKFYIMTKGLDYSEKDKITPKQTRYLLILMKWQKSRIPVKL